MPSLLFLPYGRQSTSSPTDCVCKCFHLRPPNQASTIKRTLSHALPSLPGQLTTQSNGFSIDSHAPHIELVIHLDVNAQHPSNSAAVFAGLVRLHYTTYVSKTPSYEISLWASLFKASHISLTTMQLAELYRSKTFRFRKLVSTAIQNLPSTEQNTEATLQVRVLYSMPPTNKSTTNELQNDDARIYDQSRIGRCSLSLE